MLRTLLDILNVSCADVNGKLDDTVYSRKPTALDGAVVRGTETQALPENFQPITGDDVIHIFPKLFIRQVSFSVLECTRLATNSYHSSLGVLALQHTATQL